MAVEMKGFDDLMKTFKESPNALHRQLILTVQKEAEKLAGLARAGCPVDTGQTRNSIQAYVEVHGEEIEGGARSSDPVAVYLEMGTGPKGQASEHPMAGELGVTYSPDGWRYQSEKVAAMRGEEYIPGETGGWVYTEGQSAKAFLYNAMVAMEDELTAAFGAAAEEALQ